MIPPIAYIYIRAVPRRSAARPWRLWPGLLFRGHFYVTMQTAHQHRHARKTLSSEKPPRLQQCVAAPRREASLSRIPVPAGATTPPPRQVEISRRPGSSVESTRTSRECPKKKEKKTGRPKKNKTRLKGGTFVDCRASGGGP